MSRTWFVRIEPRATSSDLTAGVAARVYDPLWILGRQWQLGELLGEDAGTPVRATLDAETAMLAAYRPHHATADLAYDPAALPLEALVEAEPVRTGRRWTLRQRIDAGREVLRALAAANLGAYTGALLDAYPIARVDAALRVDDPAAARLADVAAGRIPDGEALYLDVAAALAAGGPLPQPQGVAAADVDPLRAVASGWLDWCHAVACEPAQPSAWRHDRLHHDFTVATSAATGAMRLAAPEHSGGSLDWHAFDARPGATPKDFTALPTVTVVPTGVRFRGMPNARWWELEDASIDFGSIDGGPSDSARLAMLEFGLVYANDFFAVPLRLAVGALCRVTSLVVADTFGMRLRIGPAAHGAVRQGDTRWTMFTLCVRDPAQPAATGVADVLFLPPVASQVLADRPLEEVLLLRDEMANLSWAVERRREGQRGVAEEGAEAQLRDRPVTPPPDVGAALRYTLGTTVPDHWFPLVRVLTGGDVRLQLQRMANQPSTLVPRGTFLSLGGPSLPDAAVPREGRRLLRDAAFTRWSNGVGLVWSRRRSRVGRGEGSSDLRFDVAE